MMWDKLHFNESAKYATKVPTHLRALPIINTRLMRPGALPSSIGAICAFNLALCCVALMKGKVCFACALQLTIHPIERSIGSKTV